MTRTDFKVKRSSDGDYIIIRLSNNRHGHFVRESSAYDLIDMLCKGKLPKSEYFRDCAKRLLSDSEFKSLRSKIKPKYVNQRRR